MKTNSKDIDKLIKETLTEEEAKFYDDLDEQDLFGMFRGLFKGKMKWLIIAMNIVNLVVFVLLIYCIVQFFHTEEINELIKWASAGFVCLLIGGMIKLYAWMQMDKNALMREIKRLELQVSSLSARLPE
ncbi:hypothetical protein GCM10023311_01590 [Flaviramulus aquimarinus]|uniref:Holin-X, holin superfamily III n=1 Tax=Flaviramulus aquimarinus TaxID=1170456 RepID=A0ABP9EQL2_9FLAO